MAQAQPRRRTQAERRETTIARLLAATIASLAENGYSKLTCAGVCKRAEMSQGALFRHFNSRAELIAAATEEVCRRHLEVVGTSLAQVAAGTRSDPIAALVHTIRDATRTPEHAAWHEVMVAARTDAELHALVAPTLKAFEQSLLAGIAQLGTGTTPPTARLGTIMLSLMHLFDSEAVTVAVYGNPPLESDRVEWLIELLRRELG